MLGLGSWGPRHCSVLLAAFIALGAPSALAQGDTERAGARAAATEGGKAFDQGRYAEAIDLFTRAESLVHAPPHLLFIARSHEKLGQLVKSREAYLKITREKLAADAPEAFKEAQASATQELAALEPRIPYLTITVVGEGAEGATVTMDGQPVPKALVGVPYPVDPGEHKIQATGSGVQSPEQSVTVAESAKESIELALAPAEGAAPGAGDGTAPGDGSLGGDVGTEDLAGTDPMRIGAFVALGVGVVGLAGGTFFLLRAGSKDSEADDLCTLPGGGCPAEKQDEINSLDDEASSARTMATVGFIVGGVGVATGVTLFLLSGNKSSSASNKPGVTPWVGLGSAGVSGRF